MIENVPVPSVPPSENAPGPAPSEPSPATVEAIGLKTHNWTSPDGKIHIVFGKPQGAVYSKIARVLGDQSMNQALNIEYRALLGIRSFTKEGGAQNWKPPLYTANHFMDLEVAFGDEDNLQDYIVAYGMAVNPILAKAIADAQAAGESPDTMNNIRKHAEATEVRHF